MNRLLVALLSSLDVLVHVAVGLVAVAAPLALLWATGMDGAADWGALWPSTAVVWQLGNLVPFSVSLPTELLTRTGIPFEAASFSLSLAPLAFAALTVLFGSRSGVRAARAGAWITGVAAAAVVSAAAGALVALTSQNPLVRTELWQAIVIPAALYTGAVLAGALVTSWREGDDGPVDALRELLGRAGRWEDVPGQVLRGAGVALAALLGAGALATGLILFLRGGEVIALYQASGADVTGVIVLALGQLALLPTLIVWALSWIAGPGFSLGAGSPPVSPVWSEVGPLPGIPVLGAVPEAASPWLLLCALLPVAAGALAAWPARRGLLTAGAAEPVLPRLVTAVGIALLSALAAAALAAAASGSIGPGALAEVGPDPGPLALSIGVEVLLGAAVLLFAPMRREVPALAGEPAQGEPSVRG